MEDLVTQQSIPTSEELAKSLVADELGEFRFDSRTVAQMYGKQHRHVLRDVRLLLANTSPRAVKFSQSNFGLATYRDGQGKERPCYSMTLRGLWRLGNSYDEDAMLRTMELAEEAIRIRQGGRVSAWNAMHELDKQEAGSIALGRDGSLKMNKRKQEKPVYEAARAMLMNLLQIPLFPPRIGGSQ